MHLKSFLEVIPGGLADGAVLPSMGVPWWALSVLCSLALVIVGADYVQGYEVVGCSRCRREAVVSTSPPSQSYTSEDGDNHKDTINEMQWAEAGVEIQKADAGDKSRGTTQR